MKRLPGVLVLFLFACAGELLPPAPAPLPPSPPPPSFVPAVSVVSGDNQTGTFGQFLAESLVVRVTDDAGRGVSARTVYWFVESGFGEFGNHSWYTVTGAGGLASIRFRPGWPSPAKVTAAAGDDFLSTFFTENAGGPPVVLMQVLPNFDCGDSGGSLFRGPSDSIPFGATVEWNLWCAGQLRSISVPPGGTPFDSGLISGQSGDQHYIAPLNAPGDWTIQELLSGEKVTLRVRP